MKSLLSGLYYPFSRCIQPTSLKQMLLVFDELTFVDPVDDAQWRAKLFSDLEPYDTEFAQYQGVDQALPTLIEEGCIKRFDPRSHVNSLSLATESALNDLSDRDWLTVASTPQRFGMPSIPLRGNHSWQVFKPKLPDEFLSGLRKRPDSQSHLLVEGDEWSSWSLSYAAGSAIGISVHLEIADELNLAPITDSPMHHRLLLMKMGRSLNVKNTATPIADNVMRLLTMQLVSTLLSQVLPEEHLRRTSFEEIIRFREETTSLRKCFVDDIEARIGQLRCIPDAEEWVVSSRQVLSTLQGEFRSYEAEFASTRMKIWPRIIKSATCTVPAGSFAGVGLSLIPGPHALLIGGITGLAAAAGSAGLQWAAERVKIERSASPSVAYLSTVSKQLR